jgi:hypothetical protein
MRFHRLRAAWRSIAIASAVSCLAVWLVAAARRDERLLMAAYYEQKAAESLNAAREKRSIADLAEGKVSSPILPFLNPIARPEPHRLAAAAHDERAARYRRLCQIYDEAAARPWQLVDRTGRAP